MAEALLAREVLDADQVKRLAAGLPLDDPQPVAARTVSKRTNRGHARRNARRSSRALNKPLPQE